jgi:hypothetical protein
MNRPHIGISLMILGMTAVACNTPTPPPHVYTAGCSPAELISAINQANLVSGSTVISLEADCEYTFTSAYSSGTIGGVPYRSALPPITGDIEILGNNAVLTTNNQNGSNESHFGFFMVQPDGFLQAKHLTMQNGRDAKGGAVFINRGSAFFDSTAFLDNHAEGMPPNIIAEGGAIYNREGSLTVLGESLFKNNRADRFSSGGIEDTDGGGIFNSSGSLWVIHSSFEGNTADLGGAIGIRRSAGAEGREGVIISSGEFKENLSSAIYADGERTFFVIAASDFTVNLSSDRGGAIRLKDSILDLGYSVFSRNTAPDCGAVDSSQNSELTVTGTEFDSNVADGRGGALCHDGDSLKIDYSQFLTNIAGDSGGGVFATRPFSIRNTTFDSNVASEYGGGVFAGAPAEIDGSTFSENRASQGGGLFARESSSADARPDITVAIRQSTFYANQASRSVGHGNGYGGGIAFEGKELKVDQSAIWGNMSIKGAGVYASLGSLTIVNSTISSNTGIEGAGLYLESSTALAMDFSSLIDNQADTKGAAVELFGPATIQNSIITGFADATACLLFGAGPFHFLGTNMDNDGSCYGFSMSVNNPGTYAVADNGGPTYTNALSLGSPAVDAGDCHGVTVDQRGQARPSGAGCDLGAFELSGFPDNYPSPVSPLPNVTGTPPAMSANCQYKAAVNANCRAGDDVRTALVKVLAKGDVVTLLSLNPELTHGLFEIPDGRSCWVWLPLMEGPADPARNCSVTIVDPPPYAPEGSACSSDLPKDQCEAAGGTWSGGMTTAPRCVCPQQESSSFPSSGTRAASCALTGLWSGDPIAGPERPSIKYFLLRPFSL